MVAVPGQPSPRPWRVQERGVVELGREDNENDRQLSRNTPQAPHLVPCHIGKGVHFARKLGKILDGPTAVPPPRGTRR